LIFGGPAQGPQDPRLGVVSMGLVLVGGVGIVSALIVGLVACCSAHTGRLIAPYKRH